jgi:hypothetical protein
MPKARTTGCLQEHFGPNCADCTRVRVRRMRARARKRNGPTPRLPLTEEQRLANAAAAYVRTYLRRGAIAPPDACERCELEVQISPSRPLRHLRFFHPDPAQVQLVAWLCADCYRHVRATREPITLTWQWPGLTAPRSRRPPNLPRHLAATQAALEDRLPLATTPSLRDAAFIGTLVRALAPGERERLFAAGSLAGPRWQPTADPHLDALLRAWVFSERSERGGTARAGGGVRVTPIPAPSRRSRRAVISPPPAGPVPRAPFDPEASWAAIQRALERLDAADAAAQATNARVTAILKDESG